MKVETTPLGPTRRLKRALFEEVVKPGAAIRFANFEPSGSYTDEMRAFEPECLYAFAADGFVKVGRAEDWRKRLAQVQYGCPLPIAKLHVVQVPRVGLAYAEYYAHLHMEQIGTPTFGEWFICGSDRHAEVVSLLGRSRTRGQAYARHWREWERAWGAIIRERYVAPDVLREGAKKPSREDVLALLGWR